MGERPSNDGGRRPTILGPPQVQLGVDPFPPAFHHHECLRRWQGCAASIGTYLDCSYLTLLEKLYSELSHSKSDILDDLIY
ncbi:hypothetical protein Y032_0044g942 [Ancylostoma ceylanicum]|uniref:Uncharacterized protein n=1 Tax=Ancylostoma ceylanicum TaxID=53326 RepID=A0A016UDF1_9BILA|nr:hypothetical protein Y032_0044g942 [Ancylostoma ceylanicum]